MARVLNPQSLPLVTYVQQQGHIKYIFKETTDSNHNPGDM